ncbi:MAG: Asp-tRNA(Asn)/Glu-tRNA(Gln) amidotransferase subunit GatB [Chloroflexota bacterium]
MTASKDYGVVIGLEVHAQLLTRSKMFCRCAADYAGAAPNTRVCAVCAGMPGALPVINRQAVEDTIRSALALNCAVANHSKFDRKNYAYPDLPKGYQITQYDQPIGSGGWLQFASGGEVKRCGIVRVHLEEDTGKSIHSSVDGHDVSLVDYNRSGVPLMEIVSEPELDSPESARDYFVALRRVLMYLGVSDGNLQEGSLRADVNVSLRQPDGSFGTKVEIKNLNSFRAVERSLHFEVQRQRSLEERGEVIGQETRGWSERDEVTVGQRSKEYAHDYRYFPEPDLPPLVLGVALVESLRQTLTELPERRRERLERDFELSPAVAGVLTGDIALADYFESVLAARPGVSAVDAANWITGEVLRLRNENAGTATALTADSLAGLLRLVYERKLSSTAAKTVLGVMFSSGEPAKDVAVRLDLLQISDETFLETLVEEICAANPKAVEDFRKGKQNAAQALVGKAMVASKGRADPARLRALIMERLLSE